MIPSLRSIAVLDAPSNLGLKPARRGRQPGVRRLPQALRGRQLIERLAATDGGVVVAPDYDPRVDPATGIRNTGAIAEYTRSLASALERILDGGGFPLVLGGDCSILLGAALALRRRGRFGLAFLDGHQDLLTPETSATGGAAGMDLALACGVGPPALTTFDGVGPLLDPGDVLLLGDRSGDEGYPGQDIARVRGAMFNAGLEDLRRLGPGETVARGLASLEDGVEGLWIHLDADVIEDGEMPAVDSRQPGGLAWDELHLLLTGLLRSGLAAGMQITILDPDGDEDGKCAEAMTAALERAFAEARRG